MDAKESSQLKDFYESNNSLTNIFFCLSFLSRRVKDKH